jgi:glyoxylase-like metal-dependent hydrolase (beta-lactamase superfamily II)
MNWLEQARGTVGDLRYVVLTDGVLDRQMGTCVCEVPIVGTEATLRALAAYDEDRPRRDFLEALTTRYPEETGAFESLLPRKPMLAFNEVFVLHAGDREIHFEAVEGAGPGSLWVYLPDQELLIAGDTVVSAAVPPMAETPDSKAWLNTMTSLAHRQTVKSVVPGRGAALIPRADIEPQREFMRVMRRAARTVARKGEDNLGLSRTAQELGQTFFNGQGQKAVKAIRAGLERLVTEILASQEETSEEED